MHDKKHSESTQSQKVKAETQFNLGLLYAQGQKVKYDLRMAAQFFYEAAEFGHAEAAFFLGLCCTDDDAILQHYKSWFEKVEKNPDQYSEEVRTNVQLFWGQLFQEISPQKISRELARENANQLLNSSVSNQQASSVSLIQPKQDVPDVTAKANPEREAKSILKRPKDAVGFIHPVDENKKIKSSETQANEPPKDIKSSVKDKAPSKRQLKKQGKEKQKTAASQENKKDAQSSEPKPVIQAKGKLSKQEIFKRNLDAVAKNDKDAEAHYQLALCYDEKNKSFANDGKPMPRNRPKAQEHYQKAFDLGHALAEADLDRIKKELEERDQKRAQEKPQSALSHQIATVVSDASKIPEAKSDEENTDNQTPHVAMDQHAEISEAKSDVEKDATILKNSEITTDVEVVESKSTKNQASHATEEQHTEKSQAWHIAQKAFKEGCAAYFSGEYPTANREIKKAADYGHVLGCLFYGAIFEKDNKKAETYFQVVRTQEKWFLSLASTKNAKKLFYLGLYCEHVSKNLSDQQKAFGYLKQAADMGEVEAQNYLGLYYIKRDRYELADPWLQKAMGAGHMIARARWRKTNESDQDQLKPVLEVKESDQDQLKPVLEVKESLDAEIESFKKGFKAYYLGQRPYARENLKKAVDAGNLLAFLYYAIMLREENRHKEANRCFKELQNREQLLLDELNSTSRLLFMLGVYFEAKPDDEKAVKNFGEAGALGEYGLGKLDFKKGEYRNAVEHFKKATHTETIADAKFHIGLCYLKGVDKAKGPDPDQAYKYFEEASKEGHVLARYQLGLRDLKKSDPESQKNAYEHFAFAAEQGHEEAQGHLQKLQESTGQSLGLGNFQFSLNNNPTIFGGSSNSSTPRVSEKVVVNDRGSVKPFQFCGANGE